MSSKLSIYIGFDPRQPLAYNVMAHSVASRLTRPAAIVRLQLDQLPITRMGLTEFTYSRFLAPFLCDYDGYSLFLDADMIALTDVGEILKDVDPTAAVSVVMHEAIFERPSLMVFNNKRCTMLTPAFLDDPSTNPFNLPGWASKVGALPKDWNHVVGYNPQNNAAKVVHYTAGIPCWPETDNCEWAEAWHLERMAMTATCGFRELMGASVHVARGIVTPRPLGQRGQLVGAEGA